MVWAFFRMGRRERVLVIRVELCLMSWGATNFRFARIVFRRVSLDFIGAVPVSV